MTEVILTQILSPSQGRAIAAQRPPPYEYMFLTAQAAPDFVVIRRFRKRHLKAFTALFTQALGLCARAGLVSLGNVALDGSKIRANASRHRAMSYDRMVRAEAELAAEVEVLLADAERTDAAEDAVHGDCRGDELPAELARRQGRLAAIGEAKADLEAEHAAKARVKAEQAAGIEQSPKTLLADAGYFSEANVEAACEVGIDPLIATGRQKHGTKSTAVPRGRIPKGLTPKQLMTRKLSTNKGKAAYARRKAIVEPVFGQMKVAQDAGRLRLRGLDNAQGEWTLQAFCQNARKLRDSGFHWIPIPAVG